jgi:hypothetical protein
MLAEARSAICRQSRMIESCSASRWTGFIGLDNGIGAAGADAARQGLIFLGRGLGF